MTAHRYLSVAFALALLAGCAAPEEFPEEDPPQDGGAAQTDGQQQDPGGAQAGDSGAEAGAAEGAERFEGEALQDESSPLSQRVFYFEFDSSELSDEALEVLQAHGEYLATHPERRVIVEGHTDERGTREYNLALGERRAKAVARVLKLHGAADEQVETVSFGEEKPAVTGHTEDAWAQNRRAELIYAENQ